MLFSKETYIGRRKQLKELVESGLVILFGNNEMPNNYPNNFYYPFRQDSTFLYYFGVQRDGLVGIIDVDNDSEMLVGDDIDIEDIVWYGSVESVQQLAEQVGVNKSAPMASLRTICNEALAKKALDAKVGVDQQVASLQANYDQITANVDALKQQVEQLKMKLDEARSRQQVLVARSRMADAAQKTAVTITSATTDSAFAKLDALERKIAEKEATAEAYGAMTGMAAAEIIISDEDEFAQLKHEAAVNDQLAALKAELGLD